jgi:PAS domain S-box-containing protein
MIRDAKLLEAYLGDLLNSMPDASFLVDPTASLVQVNASTEAMLGYESKELQGKSINTLIPARFRSAHASQTSDYFARPRSRVMGVGLSLRALRKDGIEVPVEISLSPIETDRGTYVLGAIRDVSRSEERYRAIFAQVGVGVMHSNSKGRVLNVNPKFCEISGYTREEALALGIRQLTHPEDMGRSLQARAQLLAGMRSAYERDLRFIRKDGTEIWTHVTTSLIRGADGGPVHFISLIHDISAQKQAEEERREIALRFQQVTENIRDVFWLVDHVKNEMLYVSPAYEVIWGRSRRSLYSAPRDWLDAIHPEDRDRVLKASQTKQLTGDYDEEYRIVRPDASVRWIRDRAFPVHSEGGRDVRVAGIAEDITERKHADEERLRYVEQLKRTLMSTVEVATALSGLRDPYTSGHEHRVAGIAAAIGAELGFDTLRQEGLRIAGQLHDIGKITIPSEILTKPGKLNAIEYQLIQGHPRAGYDVLKGVEFPWPVAQVALQHHERMDGTGYPQGLKGEAILFEARIMAVADVVEAMSSHRPYRPGLGIEKALAEIERGRGTLYDLNVVDACLRLFQEKRYELSA